MTLSSIDNNRPCRLCAAIKDHLPLVESGQLLIARTWDVSWLFLDGSAPCLRLHRQV
jgi:hypothetical protein